ncbi:hypothetical protein EVAR_52755_1 [Eumeta japonica]|uniref:Uncharacterized protein n=1 Tax=Eumeta variegata TaxID=151549 RepID=A0A4C1XGD5_EUMVA|nr:hypothetical protein EVAR_52755_1 [Eumeta japonica]
MHQHAACNPPLTLESASPTTDTTSLSGPLSLLLSLCFNVTIWIMLVMRFVVERQIRGSAVGCMLHVDACCRQAPAINNLRATNELMKSRIMTNERVNHEKVEPESRLSLPLMDIRNPRGVTVALPASWVGIE